MINLGLGTSAGIGDRKSEVSCHRDVTSKSAREIQRKVNKWGVLANVYSPVSQEEEIKTMKERKVCCMLLKEQDSSMMIGPNTIK